MSRCSFIFLFSPASASSVATSSLDCRCGTPSPSPARSLALFRAVCVVVRIAQRGGSCLGLVLCVGQCCQREHHIPYCSRQRSFSPFCAHISELRFFCFCLFSFWSCLTSPAAPLLAFLIRRCLHSGRNGGDMYLSLTTGILFIWYVRRRYGLLGRFSYISWWRLADGVMVVRGGESASRPGACWPLFPPPAVSLPLFPQACAHLFPRTPPSPSVHFCLSF